jgi:hypothetical protein
VNVKRPVAQHTKTEYVGVTIAARVAGRSVPWVQHWAALGRIRTLVEPGFPVRYRVEDLLKYGKPQPATAAT